MQGNFFKAFLICFFSLLLIFIYEAVYPYVPALQGFETAHFWTAYKTKTAQNLVVEDSTAFLEDLKSFEQDTMFSDSLLNDDSMAFQLQHHFTPAKLPDEIDNFNGFDNLNGFFSKLKDLRQGKRKKVRIAYFGDSTTESDLIVSDLRNMLQKIFGGSGVGFVSVAPLGARGRRSIIHKHSSNWSVVSYFRQNKNTQFQYGITGDYATAIEASTDRSHKLSFQTYGTFSNVYLYYGKGNSELHPELLVLNNPGDSALVQLNEKELLNRVQLNAKNSKSIDMAFNFPEPFPVYGLSFESDNGIMVDNLAKRSDSGSNFGRISREMLSSFNKYMEYDLIVLHFGANVFSNDVVNYGYYEQILISTVRHFKESMGDIPVLIVGSTDRVAKIEGEERTSPAVFALTNAQKRAAARSNSAYIDLFSRMGGEGSMLNWVKSNPPKAAPDYVHLNGPGAKQLAIYVFDYLSEGYEKLTGQKLNNNALGKK
jgi:hypothetical protein